MTTSSDERNPVEALAEEFLDRKRRGEQPTLARIRRALPRAGRRDPRPVPGALDDGRPGRELRRHDRLAGR